MHTGAFCTRSGPLPRRATRRVRVGTFSSSSWCAYPYSTRRAVTVPEYGGSWLWVFTSGAVFASLPEVGYQLGSNPGASRKSR